MGKCHSGLRILKERAEADLIRKIQNAVQCMKWSTNTVDGPEIPKQPPGIWNHVNNKILVQEIFHQQYP